jgi:hypothetical protein
VKSKKVTKEWIKDPLMSFLSFGFLMLKGAKRSTFSFLCLPLELPKGRKRKKKKEKESAHFPDVQST